MIFNQIGRFRDLPSWRKAFKAQWRMCRNTPITLPLNPKYRPDPYLWVCTCPYFCKSRFLICKHLVHAVHPVDPVFFLEVQRNRTLPFWSHPALVPILPPTGPTQTQVQATSIVVAPVVIQRLSRAGQDPDSDDDGVGSDDDDDLVDMGAPSSAAHATFDDRLTTYLQTIREFCDGLEYQRKFQDSRFLDTLEREGAGFLRLAGNCLSRERRENSTRSAAPTTWERSTANAMLYRSRPPPSDRNT